QPRQPPPGPQSHGRPRAARAGRRTAPPAWRAGNHSTAPAPRCGDRPAAARRPPRRAAVHTTSCRITPKELVVPDKKAIDAEDLPPVVLAAVQVARQQPVQT